MIILRKGLFSVMLKSPLVKNSSLLARFLWDHRRQIDPISSPCGESGPKPSTYNPWTWPLSHAVIVVLTTQYVPCGGGIIRLLNRGKDYCWEVLMQTMSPRPRSWFRVYCYHETRRRKYSSIRTKPRKKLDFK